MALELNKFQISILRVLNGFPRIYIDIEAQKDTWFNDNPRGSIQDMKDKIESLITNGLIVKEDNTYWLMRTYKPNLETLIERFRIEPKGREYLANLPIAETKIKGAAPILTKDNTKEDIGNKSVSPPPVLVNENEKIITDHLACLSMKWKGLTIMRDEEYKRLIQYVSYLIDTGNLPENIIPIPRTNTTNNFLMRTLYLLYGKYKKRALRNNWIEFLHLVFAQFSTCKKSTTEKHFSQYPKTSNYNEDLAECMRSNNQ